MFFIMSFSQDFSELNVALLIRGVCGYLAKHSKNNEGGSDYEQN